MGGGGGGGGNTTSDEILFAFHFVRIVNKLILF